MEQASSVLLYVPGAVGWVTALLLLIYNAVALFLFMHERADQGASQLALLAWGAGLASVLSWCAPGLGGLLAFVAVWLARQERVRIYRDEAPLAGATPVRLAHLNGASALVLHSAMWVVLAARWLAGLG